MNLKLIATAAAAGLLSTSAMAADLPSRRVPPPVIAAVPVFTWTGFYVGAQVGYAWEQVTLNTAYSAGWQFNNDSRTRGGVVGGGHIGYLFQPGMGWSSLVIGVEGDVEGGSAGRGGFRASIRGRVGWTMDRFMIYATGGVAFSDFYQVSSGTAYAVNSDGTYASWGSAFNNSYRKFQTGWTVGGGVEYALTTNWAARVEYRYSDYGKASMGYYPVVEARRTENAVRAGVSYRFNTGNTTAPVVAKY